MSAQSVVVKSINCNEASARLIKTNNLVCNNLIVNNNITHYTDNGGIQLLYDTNATIKLYFSTDGIQTANCIAYAFYNTTTHKVRITTNFFVVQDIQNTNYISLLEITLCGKSFKCLSHFYDNFTDQQTVSETQLYNTFGNNPEYPYECGYVNIGLPEGLYNFHADIKAINTYFLSPATNKVENYNHYVITNTNSKLSYNAANNHNAIIFKFKDVDMIYND